MKQITTFLIILILLTSTGCSFKTSSKQDTDPQENAGLRQTPSSSEVLLSVSPSAAANPTSAQIQPSATVTPSSITDAIKKGQSDKTNNEAAAKKLLSSMTLEEKIGQMFFARCNDDTAVKDIKTWHLGGFVLFSENFSDKKKTDVSKTISGYQKISKIPMLIGVDEEGGTVNRISKYRTFRAVPFKSAQKLYTLGGFSLIKRDTKEKADLLKSLGINVNLAPVCDISTNPHDFIYQRSFGKNAQATSEYVKAVVSTMKSENIGSTLKHFPGYGNNVDTHTQTAIDKRSYHSLKTKDFLPFQAGISAGADSILVSHLLVNALDKNYPASLSPAVHDIIRKDFGFDGVIMTDDLSMGAIKKYSAEAAAVLAVSAGNDLILTSDYNTQIPAILKAVKDKKISEDSINESVQRILLWKLSLKIISNK